MEHYSLYFDAALVNNVDINDPSTASQLAFANYMIEEVSHYELTLNNKGCLTVNGLDADKAPVAFYIQYHQVNNKWLILDIDVAFLESNQKYESQALCPEQVRVK